MHDATSIRAFEDDDLDGVLEVLRRALGETPLLRRTPELFAWKHFENPFGRSIILVAQSRGRIAGLRAFMRWQLVTADGRRVRCVRAVDTATDPDFLRRGIFRALTNEAVEAARADGVELIFNTPNPQSGPGYLSMGWMQVGSIGVFARPRLRHLAGRASSEELPDPSVVVPGAESVSDLTLPVRASRGLRTPRTDQYLRWRFTQHPTARYVRMTRGTGVALLRPNRRAGRKEVVVSDLFGPDPAPALRSAARQTRAAYLVSWFSRRAPERAALVRSGLLPVPGAKALTLMARPLVDLGIDYGSLDEWDLALSDLELL